MARIATDQGQAIGHGDGGNLQIGKGKRLSFLLKSRPEPATDIGGLGVKADDVDGRQQDLLQIVDVPLRLLTFPGTMDNFGYGYRGDCCACLAV